MGAFGGDGDGNGAFGAFLEEWTLGFLIMVGAVGVGEFHIAGTKDLESIMKVGSGGEGLGAEAGAGIVDFDKEQRLAGVIAYGGLDVGRVTACDREKRGKKEQGV